jgi:hypothetical protein
MNQSSIAWFVSSHGLGHAARASAVMAALQERFPELVIHLVTRSPEAFFRETVSGSLVVHPVETDVGLVQKNSLHEDIPATLERLRAFYPFKETLLDELAAEVCGCRLVVCDIAPLGIAVARRAGIPSVLIENFLWDWIYEGYLDDYPELQDTVDYLRPLFESADIHIQTEPGCIPIDSADLMTFPVARKVRMPPDTIRKRLSLGPDENVLLLTMGGTPEDYRFAERLKAFPGVRFIVLGGAGAASRNGNLILLPHHSGFYHPDLLNACDAVVGKVGYSTIAEIYHAAIPFGYVTRPRFREAQRLADFVDANMVSVRLPNQAFHDGKWIERLPDLLALSRESRQAPNGADQAADFLAGKMDK